MKALVLVGGSGTRLRPLTFAVPKPLLAFRGKPILQLMLEHLKELGFEEVILATGYLAELVRAFCGDGSRFGLDVRYVHEERPLGTAGPLSLISGLVEQDEFFLLVNGDVVTSAPLDEMLDFARRNDFDLTVGYTRYTYRSPFGVLQVDENRVLQVHEKPQIHQLISAGIYVVKPSVIRRVPADAFFTMPELMESLWKNRRPVGAWEVRDFWLGVEELHHLEGKQGAEGYDEDHE